MKWYEGSIPEAIQLAKSKRSVFIVYVTGEDEESTKMDAVWTDSGIEEICQRADCVAIKIAANSDACGQFSIYYPVVVVPTVFLIGDNGIPLEVTGGALTVSEFHSRVKTALQNHRVQQSGQSDNQTTSQPTAPTSDQSQPAAQPTLNPVYRSDVTPSQSEPQSTSNQGSIQEKVEKARQVIQQKQAAKAKEECEKSIEQEKDRRRLGQTVQVSKQRKEEAEMREVQQELRRRKDEDRLARERVREQIARDRAERAERFQSNKAVSDQTREAESRAREESQKEAAEQLAAQRSLTARLQFRLPDGSSVTQAFPSSEPLSTAMDFISQHVGSTFGPLVLSTLYPRRSFSSQDMGSSLSSLQLSPSAIIMVLPEQRVSTQSSGGGILALILAPFLAVWGFLYNLIFASPARPRGAYNPGASAQDGDVSDDDNVPSEATARPNRPRTAYKRRTPPTVSKREGNIHKFSNAEDDDDMATWNGNSTQQM